MNKRVAVLILCTLILGCSPTEVHFLNCAWEVPYRFKQLPDQPSRFIYSDGLTLEAISFIEEEKDPDIDREHDLFAGTNFKLIRQYYDESFYLKEYENVLDTRDGRIIKPIAILSGPDGSIMFFGFDYKPMIKKCYPEFL
jgi:hypothetical protein